MPQKLPPTTVSVMHVWNVLANGEPIAAAVQSASVVHALTVSSSWRPCAVMAALGSAHGVVATCPFGPGQANLASSFQLSHESPGRRSLLVIRTFQLVIVPTGPCPGLRSVVN